MEDQTRKRQFQAWDGFGVVGLGLGPRGWREAGGGSGWCGVVVGWWWGGGGVGVGGVKGKDRKEMIKQSWRGASQNTRRGKRRDFFGAPKTPDAEPANLLGLPLLHNPPPSSPFPPPSHRRSAPLPPPAASASGPSF